MEVQNSHEREREILVFMPPLTEAREFYEMLTCNPCSGASTVDLHARKLGVWNSLDDYHPLKVWTHHILCVLQCVYVQL
jgi:hypothetical protein